MLIKMFFYKKYFNVKAYFSLLFSTKFPPPIPQLGMTQKIYEKTLRAHIWKFERYDAF